MKFDARLLVRLYPRKWRERYEEEFLQCVGESAQDWRIVMDISRAAISEWLDTPNMKGARELGRWLFGFAGGIAIILGISVLAQVAVLHDGRPFSGMSEILTTSRGLVRPISKVWMFAMTISSVVAIVMVRTGLHRSRPRLTASLTKYLLPVAFAALIIATAPPFARISTFSRVGILEVGLFFWLAGIIVDWALFGVRRRPVPPRG